jgi:LmbE family N-acetylglucosaminyl deacetylase
VTGLRLMCVLAHPDDESLGTGGALAKYAGEGVETYLVTATRGERGRFGDSAESPGPEIVGRTREVELLAAAKELGLREVKLLGYEDGALDRADPAEAIKRIEGHLRRVRPHVVITFGPEGAYGHPDHIAISQLTTAAVVSSADAEFAVSKLYYLAWSEQKWAAYQTAFKTMTTRVDGVERKVTPWPGWAITTVIDTRAVWPAVWRAVICHRTQMSTYRTLEGLSDEFHRSIWGTQEFYRAFSLVNGGRARESDLFEGLRRNSSDEGRT